MNMNDIIENIRNLMEHIHDLHNHLQYEGDKIKKLENRIIQLEVQLSKKRLVMDDDSWYWDH